MHVIQLDNKKLNIDFLLKKIDKEDDDLLLEYGKNHKKVAVLIPYHRYRKRVKGINFGCLKGKAEIEIKDDFKLIDSDFFQS